MEERGQPEPGTPPTEEPEVEPEVEGAAAGRGRRAGLTVGKVLVALVSIVALAAAGIGWFTLERFRHDTNTTNALSEVSNDPAASTMPAPPVDDGATDILLVGSDSRTDAQGNPLPGKVLKQLRTTFDAGLNTDTIIVLRIPKNGGKAYAISIPRDSYVAIPGYRQDKINSAYGVTAARTADQLRSSGRQNAAQINQQADEAGQKALIETVQNLTGIHIDHYAEINLYGFYLLSEAIGGVDVCLKHATSDKDSGADFRAGPQTVSGSSALSFVRQRENLPNGDLSRIVRQQVFLASAAKKVLSAGTLTNPSALSGLLDTVRKSLVTDPGLDFTTLLQQGQALLSGNVEFATIPVVNSNARSPSGQSIVSVDPNQVHQFVATLVGATTPAPPPTTSAAATSAAPPPPPPPSTNTPVPNAPTPPLTVNGEPCVD